MLEEHEKSLRKLLYSVINNGYLGIKIIKTLIITTSEIICFFTIFCVKNKIKSIKIDVNTNEIF